MSSFSYETMFSCNHGEVKSFFCNDCWEAQGLSSRMIERRIKNIKTKGFFKDFIPHDMSDFQRCMEIVEKHNWKSRINELRTYGVQWSRLVSKWDELEELVNSYELITEQTEQTVSETTNSNKKEICVKINEILDSIRVENGMLKTFDFYDTDLAKLFDFTFVKNYVIGSQVVRPELQHDEMDICPCVVLDDIPKTSIKYYNTNGKIQGVKTNKFITKSKNYYDISGNLVAYRDNTLNDKSNSESNSESKSDTPIIKRIVECMDCFVKSNLETWYTYTFDMCPLYVYSKEDVTNYNELPYCNTMFFSEVYKKNATVSEAGSSINSEANSEVDAEIIGYCLISIPESHILHPKNNIKDQWMIPYCGYEWVVSPEPVVLNKLYLTDGLLNACEDSDEFLEELIETYGDKKVTRETTNKAIDEATDKATDKATASVPIKVLSVNLG